MKNNKYQRRQRIHKKIRSQIIGSANRPRLVVFRSLKHIYGQLIDDTSGKTVITFSDKEIKSGVKTEKARLVGQTIAKMAIDKKIESCVFDRNGYKYHGRVAMLADAARKEGLKF